MKIQEIVALKANPKILLRIEAINEYDIIRAEIIDAPGVYLNVHYVDLIELGANETGMDLDGSVTVLGTIYRIHLINEQDRGGELGDGYTDFSTKEIFLLNLKQRPTSLADLKRYQRQVLRHEIIHAFLFESGLSGSSHSSDAFAIDEEMVDWMAIQSPKIWKAFKEAGCDT